MAEWLADNVSLLLAAGTRLVGLVAFFALLIITWQAVAAFWMMAWGTPRDPETFDPPKWWHPLAAGSLSAIDLGESTPSIWWHNGPTMGMDMGLLVERVALGLALGGCVLLLIMGAHGLKRLRKIR